MRRVLTVVAPGAAILLLAAGCGGTKTVTVQQTVTRVATVTTTQTVTTTGGGSEAAPCTGDALGGTFAVVSGSAGAGQIVYRLALTNTSSSACFVSGLPSVQLLDANGAQLPTHGRAAQPGTATAVRVDLQPGDAATADARFSPDVPGQGETQPGQCEATAATLRVSAPGGGTVDAPIKPPTPVCEKGSLSFTLFKAAP